MARSPTTITCSGSSDDNYTFGYVDGTFTVMKEDATVTFADANPAAPKVSTDGGELDAEELTLVVKMEEKEPDLPTATTSAGNIANADLTVELDPLAGGGTIELNCTAAVEETGYDGVKTFTCTNGNPLEVNTYDVIATVTGN